MPDERPHGRRRATKAVRAAWTIRPNKATGLPQPSGSLVSTMSLATKSGRWEQRRAWSPDETNYMLKVFKDNDVASKLRHPRSQAYTYKSVQRIMAFKGYFKTPDAIRVKWKQLKTSYREAEGDPGSFEHYNAVRALLEPLRAAGHLSSDDDEKAVAADTRASPEPAAAAAPAESGGGGVVSRVRVLLPKISEHGPATPAFEQVFIKNEFKEEVMSEEEVDVAAVEELPAAGPSSFQLVPVARGAVAFGVPANPQQPVLIMVQQGTVPAGRTSPMALTS